MVTVQDILALRDQGLSDRGVAARLSLTKGQVAGLIFRARSPLYRAHLSEDLKTRDTRRLRLLVARHGAAGVIAMVGEIDGGQ